MSKPGTDVYLHEDLDEYKQLLPPGDPIRTMIEDMEAVLAEDPRRGRVVPKRQVPKYYIEKYHLNPRSPLLLVYDHPGDYRSCFIITRKDGLRILLILDIITHGEYDKRFRYRKR